MHSRKIYNLSSRNEFLVSHISRSDDIACTSTLLYDDLSDFCIHIPIYILARVEKNKHVWCCDWRLFRLLRFSMAFFVSISFHKQLWFVRKEFFDTKTSTRYQHQLVELKFSIYVPIQRRETRRVLSCMVLHSMGVAASSTVLPHVLVLHRSPHVFTWKSHHVCVRRCVCVYLCAWSVNVWSHSIAILVFLSTAELFLFLYALMLCECASFSL